MAAAAAAGGGGGRPRGAPSATKGSDASGGDRAQARDQGAPPGPATHDAPMGMQPSAPAPPAARAPPCRSPAAARRAAACSPSGSSGNWRLGPPMEAPLFAQLHAAARLHAVAEEGGDAGGDAAAGPTPHNLPLPGAAALAAHGTVGDILALMGGPGGGGLVGGFLASGVTAAGPDRPPQHGAGSPMLHSAGASPLQHALNYSPSSGSASARSSTSSLPRRVVARNLLAATGEDLGEGSLAAFMAGGPSSYSLSMPQRAPLQQRQHAAAAGHAQAPAPGTAPPASGTPAPPGLLSPRPPPASQQPPAAQRSPRPHLGAAAAWEATMAALGAPQLPSTQPLPHRHAVPLSPQPPSVPRSPAPALHPLQQAHRRTHPASPCITPCGSGGRPELLPPPLLTPGSQAQPGDSSSTPSARAQQSSNSSPRDAWWVPGNGGAAAPAALPPAMPPPRAASALGHELAGASSGGRGGAGSAGGSGDAVIRRAGCFSPPLPAGGHRASTPTYGASSSYPQHAAARPGHAASLPALSPAPPLLPQPASPTVRLPRKSGGAVYAPSPLRTSSGGGAASAGRSPVDDGCSTPRLGGWQLAGSPIRCEPPLAPSSDSRSASCSASRSLFSPRAAGGDAPVSEASPALSFTVGSLGGAGAFGGGGVPSAPACTSPTRSAPTALPAPTPPAPPSRLQPSCPSPAVRARSLYLQPAHSLFSAVGGDPSCSAGIGAGAGAARSAPPPVPLQLAAYMDYGARYGLAYRLVCGAVGVAFNDGGHALWAPGRDQFIYADAPSAATAGAQGADPPQPLLLRPGDVLSPRLAKRRAVAARFVGCLAHRAAWPGGGGAPPVVRVGDAAGGSGAAGDACPPLGALPRAIAVIRGAARGELALAFSNGSSQVVFADGALLVVGAPPRGVAYLAPAGAGLAARLAAAAPLLERLEAACSCAAERAGAPGAAPARASRRDSAGAADQDRDLGTP